MAFEIGNRHAAKRREFEAAIRRSLARDDFKALRVIADKVRDLAMEGERWAIEFLRDTLDGRPAQQIVATDNDGRAITIGLVAYAAELRPDDPVSIQTQELPAPNIARIG